MQAPKVSDPDNGGIEGSRSTQAGSVPTGQFMPAARKRIQNHGLIVHAENRIAACRSCAGVLRHAPGPGKSNGACWKRQSTPAGYAEESNYAGNQVSERPIVGRA
jgi:hypothetical protein